MSDDKSSWLENALGFVADKVRDGVQSAEKTAGSVVQSVEDAGSAVVQKAEDTVQSVGQAAGSVLQSVEDAGLAVAQKAEDTVQSVGQAAESVVQSVEDTASSFVRNVADTASGLYDKASDAASEFLKEMTDPYQFGGVQAPIVKQLEEAASGGHPVDFRRFARLLEDRRRRWCRRLIGSKPDHRQHRPSDARFVRFRHFGDDDRGQADSRPRIDPCLAIPASGMDLCAEGAVGAGQGRDQGRP